MSCARSRGGREGTGVRRSRQRARGKPPDDTPEVRAGVEAEPDAPLACAKRLEGLIEKCFADLQFLVDEFAKLEIVVRPEASRAGSTEADSKLSRLRFFTTHVRRTMDRMRAARGGRNPLTIPQLALLEEHIATSIMPVKARLELQLRGGGGGGADDGGSGGASSSIMGSPCTSSESTQGEASAGEGSASRSSSVSSSMGGMSDNLGCQDGVVVGVGVGGGGRGVGGDRHRSQEEDGEEACDVGVFLGDGSEGMSMDLLSGGQFAGPESLGGHHLRLGAICGGNNDAIGRLSQRRRDHLDLLGQLEAEGVFAADDSYASDHMCLSRDFLPLVNPFQIGNNHHNNNNNNTSTNGYKDDASSTELYEPAPTTSGGAFDGEPTPFTLMRVKEEYCDVKQELYDGVMPTAPIPPQRPEAFSGVSGTDGQVPQASQPGDRTKTPENISPADATPGCSKSVAGCATTMEVSCNGGSQTGPEVEGNVVGCASRDDAGGLPTPAQDLPAATVGADQTTVSGDPARIKSVESRSAGGSGALPGMATALPMPGVAGRGTMSVPPRSAKRRRSAAFPAALTQPREVRYQCGVCSESYVATVAGNPWWLLVRQDCPQCHVLQIPRVDILNPTNNVEGHIALLTEACTENGSDGDGSCVDWEGETSDDNSDDDYTGEEGDVQDGRGNSTSGGLFVGSTLDSEQAAKLLVLMCHARSCPGHHRSPRLAEVCRSVKFLMLHLRDCDGRTRDGQACPMPWCRPCTSLLHHLIQCPDSAQCQVCNPLHLPHPLRALRTLNQSGHMQHIQHVVPLQSTIAPPTTAAAAAATPTSNVAAGNYVSETAHPAVTQPTT